jgi:hypothetical protein
MQYSLAHQLGKRSGGLDPDAKAYIAAVETADGQALEPAIRTAYDQFIRGCKSDGIWDAIKASCILAGARSLSGALVPLVGAAPTNNNFVKLKRRLRSNDGAGGEWELEVSRQQSG